MWPSVRQRVAEYCFADAAHEQWIRRVMEQDHERWLDGLPRAHWDAVEVSGNRRDQLGWRSYRALKYPDFDLMSPPDLGQQYDVVFCEQVLEHIEDPAAGLRALFRITRPGGWLLVSTPFLVPLHGLPRDFWRPAPGMLAELIEEAGFALEQVESWGNTAAVALNTRYWLKYHRGLPLRNNPACPIVVWAYAQRPPDFHE